MPVGVLQAMGVRFAENIVYYIVVSFSIVYLKTHVGADTSDILWWLLAAHAVTRLQGIVAREVDPRESAVVTVGTFHAGLKENIIPDSAEIARAALSAATPPPTITYSYESESC